MKKVISLVVIMLSFSLIFSSCNSDDDNYIDNDTVSAIYDYPNRSFLYDANTDEFYFKDNNFPLYSGENLLIYIQSGQDNGPVWKLLPNFSNYIENNVVYPMNYNYDFTMQNFEITAWGDPMPQYLTGITFRVVVIPGFFPKSKSATPLVDYRDYNAVVKYFNIDESKVKVIKP